MKMTLATETEHPSIVRCWLTVQNLSRNAIGSGALLLLVGAGTLFFRLGGLPLTGADEPRYARIAEEMGRAHEWVTPKLQGQPWLEKPPLYYWITIPIFASLGVSEATARLGPALCALFASLVVFWLGRKLFGPLPGLYAGLILLTSLGFVGFGRSASTDMPLTASFTAALAIFCLGAAQSRISWWVVLAGYFFLGLAVLAKGPMAIFLACGIGALFWWLDARGGSLQRWRVRTGIPIVALIVLPWFWFSFHENGFSFVSVFFINHNLARYVSDIHHHSEPFYYYVPVLLGLLFPWSGWLPLLFPASTKGSLHGRRDQSSALAATSRDAMTGVGATRRWPLCEPALLFLNCWWIFTLIFFSLSRSKLPGYILPCLPPVALLLGKRLAESSLGEWTRQRLHWVLWFYLSFSGLVASAAAWAYLSRYRGGVVAGLLLGGAILLPAFVAFGYGWKRNMIRSVIGTAAQGLVLVIAVTQIAFPVLAVQHSARDIAHQALHARQVSETIATYRFFHHTLHYYTGYQIAADLMDDEALRRFLLSHPQLLIVTEVVRLEELHRLEGFTSQTVGAQGKLRLVRIVHN